MQALEPSCASSSSDPSAVKGWQMHLAKTDWFRLANTIHWQQGSSSSLSFLN